MTAEQINRAQILNGQRCDSSQGEAKSSNSASRAQEGCEHVHDSFSYNIISDNAWKESRTVLRTEETLPERDSILLGIARMVTFVCATGMLLPWLVRGEHALANITSPPESLRPPPNQRHYGT